MWSNFARAQQPAKSAPPPPAGAAPPQPEEPQQQGDPPPEDVDDGGGDAWSDDDILADELLDDVNVDEDTGGISKIDTAPNASAGTTNNAITSVATGGGGISGAVGGMGGWGSTLKSFTQHEPLNLSFGGASPPAPTPTVAHTAPAVAAVQPAENQGEDDGWNDDDIEFNESMEETPKKEAAPPPAPALTPLGRAAEHFGAALLASMDNDEEQSYSGDHESDHGYDDQEEDKKESESGGGKVGGFGGGFVMKGLSRFIEAATAPQEQEEESDGTPQQDDDGWGDDDLDFHDDDVAADADTNAGNADLGDVEDDRKAEEAAPPLPVGGDDQPPDLQDEPPMMEETTEDGWDEDDIDITFDTPQQKPVTENPKPVDSGKSSDNGISDSIKDFVAMTESALDSEFDSNMWKTPPPKQGAASSALMSSNGDSNIMNESTISSDMEDFMPAEKTVVSQVKPSSTIKDPPTNSEQGAALKLESHDDTQEEKDVLSKSLTDFVDNLDAELADLTRDAGTAATSTDKDATLPMQTEKVDSADKPIVDPMSNGSHGVVQEKESYNYDENKDDSPEPVPHRSPQPTAATITEGVEIPPALPHQESWYLNAMEDGQGGVVYGEEGVTEPSKLQPPIPKGQIIGEDEVLQKQVDIQHQPYPPLIFKGQIRGNTVDVNDLSVMIPPGNSSIVQCPSSVVGMPLSEMPSGANSAPSSRGSPVAGACIAGDGSSANPADANVKESELRCKCLELIMPLPNGEEKKSGSPPRGEPGFGTKTLPDGTTLLVNYEKLLQNEATKRILLQRSVEAYEHSLEKLQSKHQSSMETMQGQEIQLASAHSEIERLNEMVLRLQDEKENMVTETQLFEAELASAIQDKEYLEKEVESMQEDTKAKRENMEKVLQESNAEKARLIDQVEVLQSDLSEVQKERDLLSNQVQELTSAEVKSDATETEELKSLIESVQTELLEKNSEIEQLNDQLSIKPLPDGLMNDLAEMKTSLSRVKDENVMLRAMQREYDVQISELKGTIESLDCDTGEVDKLAAEVASLTYELCMKKTECEEAKTALKSMQAKREKAERRLKEYKRAAKEEDARSAASSKTDHSRGEDGLLYKQIADLQVACSSLESQKSDLETDLDRKARTIKGLESKVKSLSEDSSTTDLLQEEMAHLKKSLEGKEAECGETASALQLLKTKLDDAEAQLVAFKVASKEKSKQDSISEAEQSLKAENGELSRQLKDLRAAHSLLEGQKLGLEKSLEERSAASKHLESQIQRLNANAMQIDNVHRSELSRMQISLNDKVHECESMASSCQQLQTDLLNAQSEREVILAKSEANDNKSREETSRLQSQIADLLKENNATMRSVEEQLTSSLQQTSTLQAQCEEYRVKLEQAEKECANISQSTSDTIARYNEQISTLQREKLELSSALQTAQSKLEAHQLEAAGGDSKVKQLQKSLNAMKQEMDSIAHRHQELMDKNHCLMQEKTDITQSLEARAINAEQQSIIFQQECATLRSELDKAEKARSDAEEGIANLTEQLQALKDSNAQLEDKLFEASFEVPEVNNFAEENTSLRKERDELRKETIALSQRITELASQAGNLATSFTSVEKEALLARINTLEEEAKSEKLGELRDEITSLHEERQQLDLDNEELLIQLGLMQQEKTENQAEMELELESLRRQVSSLQDQCTRLQSDLDESRSSTLLPGEKDHVKILQDDNHSLHQTIAQLNGENESLMNQINDLTQKIEVLELHVSQGSVGGIDDEEIEALRQQIDLLQLNLADKEEEVEATKKEMKHALDSRDLEIFKLATECSSKEKEVTDLSGKLEAANTEMGSFNSQLESLQSQYEQDQLEVTQDQVGSGVAEEEKLYDDDEDDISLQDLLAEAVLDSDDYLRSQIVVLAQALERSELQRANLLERNLLERKTNMDSLRQLGESVKRFYTTVR